MTTIAAKRTAYLDRLNAPRPPMRCRCCYLPSIAICTEDVNWHLCRTHTISAGACAFFPRLLVGGELVSPEKAIQMRSEK